VQVWRPEVQVISWISERMLFENRRLVLRANLTMSLGIGVIGQAQGSTGYGPRCAGRRSGCPLWR